MLERWIRARPNFGGATIERMPPHVTMTPPELRASEGAAGRPPVRQCVLPNWPRVGESQRAASFRVTA